MDQAPTDQPPGTLPAPNVSGRLSYLTFRTSRAGYLVDWGWVKVTTPLWEAQIRRNSTRNESASGPNRVTWLRSNSASAKPDRTNRANRSVNSSHRCQFNSPASTRRRRSSCRRPRLTSRVGRTSRASAAADPATRGRAAPPPAGRQGQSGLAVIAVSSSRVCGRSQEGSRDGRLTLWTPRPPRPHRPGPARTPVCGTPLYFCVDPPGRMNAVTRRRSGLDDRWTRRWDDPSPDSPTDGFLEGIGLGRVEVCATRSGTVVGAAAVPPAADDLLGQAILAVRARSMSGSGRT